MIKTVEQLLEVVRKHEIEKLKEYKNITHGPTIGDMYEGISRKVLNHTIPEGLNLHVREGFIENSKGVQSKQIDCMIVSGEGRQIPNTNHYVYMFKDVVAIIEVKKSLYGNDLKSIIEWSQHFFKNVFEPIEPNQTRLLRDAWKTIIGQELPEYDDIKYLPKELEMIYHSLVVDLCMPIRIAIGYEGYTLNSALEKDSFSI